MKIMNTRYFYKLTLLCLLGLLSACGPVVTRNAKQAELEQYRKIALLPPNLKTEISRERAALIMRLLKTELESSGYILLDSELVNDICGSSDCPAKANLIEKYKLDGLAELSIDSLSRSNFLAGYYNTLSGKLVLSDRANKKLLEVESTERETGGLLFNSGQVLQGLKTQVAASTTDTFSVLAEKFVHKLLLEVPAQKGDQQSIEIADRTLTNLKIQSAEIVELKSPTYKVCLKSEPKLMAAVVLEKQRTSLREIEPGKYCAAFRIEDLQAAMPSVEKERGLTVEVRSSFGEVNTLALAQIKAPECSLEGRVSLEKLPKERRLALQCVSFEKQQNANSFKCQENLAPCHLKYALLYRAEQDSGPYFKVAKLTAPNWTERNIPEHIEPRYELVAVDVLGIRSAPLSLNQEGQK